jgi:putative ABC transport system permease protein
MAKKYFGRRRCVEQDNHIRRQRSARVGDMCDDVPQNSQIKFDFVNQFLNMGNGVDEETWWTANWITYLLVRDEKSIPQLKRQISDYMKTPAVRADAGLQGTDYLTYKLEPLTKVHLYSSLSGFEPNGSISYIYMFAVIALLILVIACANYTNLATAQSAGRSGEIGMRKVMGASKKQVFMQFMSESALITFVAAVVALGMSILLDR